MNSRLQQFLSAENLSQSQFADKIGVARASISHIMAGRNKPGFDFILGMAQAFPALNLDWLITGKGKMYKQSDSSVKSVNPEPVIDFSDDQDMEIPFDAKPVQPRESVAYAAPVAPVREKSPHKEYQEKNVAHFQRNISRIVVFYDDNTFQELH